MSLWIRIILISYLKLKNCWLNNFNLEYVQADFDHSGERIHKKNIKTKRVRSTGKKRRVDVGKKDAHDRNNARNRDAFAITKANCILEGEKSVGPGMNGRFIKKFDEVENVLIKLIDLKNKKY